MPSFQVSSRSVQLAAPPKKRARRFSPQWYIVVRFLIGGSIAGLIFGFLLARFSQQSHDAVFILLPVLLSLATAQFQGYNLRALFTGTLVYLLLTACLTVIYYGIIIIGPALIQQGYSHIIAISTALAWTIMFEPVRIYIQKRIGRHFNVRNREADKAIEAFTSTLREEIDLDSLRERFLTVISRTLQPYSVSLWIRTSHEQEQFGSAEVTSIADDDPLIAYVLSHPGAREIDRLQLDSPILQELKLHAADLILPLANQGELLGLLVLGPHLKGEPYNNEERTLLDTLASQVAPALRVARMVQEQQVQVRERERLAQELRTAHFIQQSLLPKEVPSFPGWQIEPYYQPAREVGGDFYDFLPFEDGQLGLVIGDVSGKGVPAALVMANTHTMIRTSAQGAISPGKALTQLNELLCAEIPPNMFVTCFYAMLDTPSGRLRYANAGHNLPYRRDCEGVGELRATGMPLGLMPESSYEEHEVTLSPGESVLFYTDGLTEAHNTKREMFDRSRLSELMRAYSGDLSLIGFLLNALSSFTGEQSEPEDDVTMVELCRVRAD